MIHVWPDVAAATSPALKVRDQLDYLVWIAATVEPLGFHGGPDLETWRGRVQRAYAALVDSMAPGHGDPLPPDVPPAVQPGTWPDVAAATIPGMTIRHQLSVIGSIAAHTREDRGFPRTPAETATWTQRIQTAYDAMDHGPSMPVPPTARTQPPPPPAPAAKGKRRTTATATKPSAGAKKAAHRPPAAKTGGKKAAPKKAPAKKAAPKKAAGKRKR
ncbi:MAG: hypothetical protein U1E39_15045 [Planctomycetota bacterium]